MKNNNITKNEHKDINIDKRILPLFSTPVILKKISEKKRNKYNFNILNPQKKLTYKIITLKQILEIFLKGISLYNFNLNNYLKKHNNLDLILHLTERDKNDEYYKLNMLLSNYFYSINKFLPVFKLKSLLYNVRLFLPKRLLKPEPHIRFSYRLRYIAKIFIDTPYLASSLPISTHTDTHTDTINKIMAAPAVTSLHWPSTLQDQIQINRTQLNKLLEKGNEIMNDLDYLINKKKNIIKNIKITNKILDTVNSLLPLKQEAGPKKKCNINLEEIGSNKSVIKDKILNPIENPKNNTYDLLLKYYEKKVIINRIFKSINKTNEIKIEQTMKSILKNNKFDYKTDTISINSNPISVLYSTFSGRPDSLNLGQSNEINASYEKEHTLSAPLTFGQGETKKKPILNQYLKSMSIYNMSTKGIFIFYSNIIGFNFNTESNKIIKNIYNLLAASFKSMYCLISKPVFIITPDKIIIQLFYYLFIPNILKLKKIYNRSALGASTRSNSRATAATRFLSSEEHKAGLLSQGRYKRISKLNNTIWMAERINRKKKIKKLYTKFRKIKIKVRIKLRKLSNITLTKVFPDKFKNLCNILSHLLKKPVELDLIRLHYPYNDSNILANLLGIMINKIKLRIIISRLFEKAVVKSLTKLTGKTKVNIIPAFLTGINIKVAGRLLTHKVVPRQTVKTTRRGASARGKVNFSDVARYTNKNKRGAFSITVASGQNYF